METFILGGDGYIGWPLSARLALKYPEEKFFIVDNFCRRRLVSEVGGESLIPILSLADKIKAFREIFKQENLDYLEMDILDESFSDLISQRKPKTLYHLAQQPSAHYSMKGVNESTFTVENNEIGNLKLLWSIKNHSPETHLIKLGSFGEYAECGLDIAEGYFFPEYNGKKAKYPTPFPRESDDVYHISKINDTNFISMACRKWGLRITDIMQSTIFGNKIEDFQGHEDLYTRFDYDQYFGTVINRFLVQAISSLPLTVYGSGNQRNGLMSLEDATSSLLSIFENIPQEGEHKVINHVVEKKYSVNELAELVKNICSDILKTEILISKGEFDPRFEKLPAKKEYQIETTYIQGSLQAHAIEDVLKDTMEILLRHKDRIKPSVMDPTFSWS